MMAEAGADSTPLDTAEIGRYRSHVGRLVYDSMRWDAVGARLRREVLTPTDTRKKDLVSAWGGLHGEFFPIPGDSSAGKLGHLAIQLIKKERPRTAVYDAVKERLVEMAMHVSNEAGRQFGFSDLDVTTEEDLEGGHQLRTRREISEIALIEMREAALDDDSRTDLVEYIAPLVQAWGATTSAQARDDLLGQHPPGSDEASNPSILFHLAWQYVNAAHVPDEEFDARVANSVRFATQMLEIVHEEHNSPFSLAELDCPPLPIIPMPSSSAVPSS